MTNNIINIPLGENVSEKHLDRIINDFYVKFEEDVNKLNTYKFDLSNLEWISNQELLVLTGLFQYLIDLDVNFRVNFLKKGSSENVDERIAKQIVEIWDVWRIHQIVPHQDYKMYFDIDGSFVERIRKRFKINTTSKEIYERYGVTPFLSLPKIENYDDNSIKVFLNKIYNLSEATNQILRENKCYLPFENKTLSSIITKELYENFLDHFTNSFFNCKDNYAFLSISLKRKLSEKHFEKHKIQSILELNFKKENIKELLPFFYDSSKSEYKNESLLQISFLDFGVGVPNTLINSFNESKFKKFDKQNTDSQVLRYAFEPLSSQHSVEERFSRDVITPRGLFDVISIVKRFEGLAVVRSNYGKIAFDFSNNNSIENATQFFGDEKLYFPGYLISIYLPERNLTRGFNTSSIKPNVNFDDYNFNKKKQKTVRLFDIQNKLKSLASKKKDLYNNLFDLLIAELSLDKTESLVYFDFEGYDIDERVSKKVIYFLSSDYRLNYQNNVIILNPPPMSFLQSIKDEIDELEEVDKKFKFHPTPFISFLEEKKELDIFWLGVYSEKDTKKLNDILFTEHDLRASDFENPDDVVGHINRYDDFGNLYSNIDSEEIFNFYFDKKKKSANEEIEFLVKNCIQKQEGSIFLCNGNYYQYEYLLFNEILSDEDKLNYLSSNLFERLKEKFGKLDDVLFAGITASSHKILDSFISLGHLQKDNCFYLNNYFSFEKEKAFSKLITDTRKVILVCDVVSTGFMVNKFKTHLIENKVELTGVGVLVNAIDKSYDSTILDDIEDKLIATFKYTLEKKKRSEISTELRNNKLTVVRINPFTNTPITHTIKDTNSNESILISNQDFLNLIDSNYIKIGYFEFNNLIHPYFFDMDSILDKSNSSSNKLLKLLVQKLNSKTPIKDVSLIFYPKESAIKNIDFEYFKNNIIPNHNIEFIKLERFSTNEGWRFSHPPKSLIEKCKDKSVLILDDGSCSGESLLQMIDEVAFFDVKKITVLSIVGRVNDHKREFFSRLKSINAGNTKIDIDIFFGCHWHLPTYHLSKSPIVDEINWLKDIQSFNNLPQKLKKIIQVVHNELKLKSIDNPNNRHLLKTKGCFNLNKDLVIVRNELGKLSEYRFYVEYFNYLDDFISKYESKSKSVRGKYPYKEIELICGVIIHEPYLFESLKKIVPDLVDKIKNFLEALFWNESVIDEKIMTYKWDIKNFIHLFFIVFESSEIINDIGIQKLSVLLNVYCKKTSDKVYFFYRVLRNLQISSEKQSNKIFSSKFLHITNELITLIERDESHFKTIPSFFSSLPNNEKDFYYQLNLVVTNYKKLLQDSSHNEYIYNDKQIIVSSLKVIEKNNGLGKNSNSEIVVIRKSWKEISKFIESMLRFSISYPNYFINDQDYLNLERSTNSLRNIHGELSNEIYNGNFEKVSVIQDYIDILFEKFINDDSRYSQLFSKPNKVNLSNYLPEFQSKVKGSINDSFNFEVSVKDNVWIDFPCYYFESTILKEITGNMRFANADKPIMIKLSLKNNSVILRIENSIISNDDTLKGGGKGTDRLQRLNDFNSYTGYDSKKKNSLYIQELIFKQI